MADDGAVVAFMDGSDNHVAEGQLGAATPLLTTARHMRASLRAESPGVPEAA